MVVAPAHGLTIGWLQRLVDHFLSQLAQLLAKAFREGAMDLSDVQQQMSSGLNFGIMNALRTGNPILDVMVCMLIPVILSLFMGNSNSDPMSTKIKDSARFLTLGYSGLVQENAALKLKTAF